MNNTNVGHRTPAPKRKYIMKQKIPFITEQLAERLRKGEYGQAGDKFISVKTLAEQCGISINSAFKIISTLTEMRLIRLHGKHYYITTGYVSPQTPYGILLASSRRKSFGMIVNRIESPFFSAIVKELSSAAADRGYSLYVLCNNNDLEREVQMIDELINLGVCGIFTNSGISPELKAVYSICPLPVVSIGRDLSLANCDNVLVDNAYAGKQVADHLMSCGCKTFAYAGLSRYLHEDPRFRGYTDQLYRYGFTLEEDHILTAEHNINGRGDTESISGQLDKVLRKLPLGEKLGIFCYHDLLAVAVLQRVRHYSHRSNRTYTIPDDVAIVGFDDLPVAETITPTLTTVHYRYNSIVNQSLRVMLDYVHNPKHTPGVHIVPSSLFIRESTVSQHARR